MYSVQFSRSGMSDSATPWTAARQASLSVTVGRHLLGLTPLEPVASVVLFVVLSAAQALSPCLTVSPSEM